MSRLLATSLYAATLILSACGASGDDEADAEANGGKSDAEGFQFGVFDNVKEFDQEDVEGLPLVAAFHADKGAIDAGENGTFDLVRYTGDYESNYTTGTFKLYTYGGKKKIRLSDEKGTVLERLDWSMKGADLVLGGEAMSPLSKLDGQLISCLSLDADYADFSDWEYPEVSVSKDEAGKLEMKIGSMNFDESEGKITLTEANGRFKAVYTAEKQKHTIDVPLDGRRKGDVEGDIDGDSINAMILCR